MPPPAPNWNVGERPARWNVERGRNELRGRWNVPPTDSAMALARRGLATAFLGLAVFYLALVLGALAVVLLLLFVGILLAPVALAVGAFGLALMAVGVGLAARSLARPGSVAARIVAAASIVPVVLGPGFVAVQTLRSGGAGHPGAIERRLPASAGARDVLDAFEAGDHDDGTSCTLEVRRLRPSCLAEHRDCLNVPACRSSFLPYVASLAVHGRRATGRLDDGQHVRLRRGRAGWELLDAPRRR